MFDFTCILCMPQTSYGSASFNRLVNDWSAARQALSKTHLGSCSSDQWRRARMRRHRARRSSVRTGHLPLGTLRNRMHTIRDPTSLLTVQPSIIPGVGVYDKLQHPALQKYFNPNKKIVRLVGNRQRSGEVVRSMSLCALRCPVAEFGNAAILSLPVQTLVYGTDVHFCQGIVCTPRRIIDVWVHTNQTFFSVKTSTHRAPRTPARSVETRRAWARDFRGHRH
jgi:hypothetical protein